MSVERNSQVLREFMEALDSDDEANALAMIDQIVDEDYVLHTGGSTLDDPQDVIGREGLRYHTRMAFQTFGDVRHIVEDEFGVGDKLVTRVRFCGRLKADWLGVSATGQQFETSIIYLHHFRNGKLREAWVDWDSLLALSVKLRAAATV